MVDHSVEQEIKKALEVPVARTTSSQPPVFVKVEKYKELVQNVHDLRSYILGLRDALDAVADIAKEFKSGMQIAHHSIDKVNFLLSSLDMKLTGTGLSRNVEGVEELTPPPEIEAHVRGIYEQIEKIKSELSHIS